MAGTVIVPWYATGFRGDAFETALGEVAATALRYGATAYGVYRARDDKYKFQQLADFEGYSDWERYWEGDEMVYFRAKHSGWYQVPVLYGWWDQTAGGAIALENGVRNGHGNGRGNGVASPAAGETA
jgi:hypothetical protein